MPDAVKMLIEDHRKVQQLFQRFEQTQGNQDRKKLVDEVLTELLVHAELEEEIVYPAFRAVSDEEVMNEADEEHHVAELLIDEIAVMDPNDEHYPAKFMVLAENVRHHIQEEEREMLPRGEALGRERLMELGQEMEQRRPEIIKAMKERLSSGGSKTRSRSRGNGRARSSSRSRPSSRSRTTPKPSRR